MKIVIYSKIGCLPCLQVKKWLQSNGVEYEEKDGPKHISEIESLGVGRSMPIVLKDGHPVTVGVFNEEMLKKVIL